MDSGRERWTEERWEGERQESGGDRETSVKRAERKENEKRMWGYKSREVLYGRKRKEA